MMKERKGWWWKKIDPDKFMSIARFLLLMLIGMFTGYTLVSLFGLIIGGILSFLVLLFFIRVMNNIADTTTTTSTSFAGLGIFSPSPTRIRYRCLACQHLYAGKRECPRCGSRMKNIEF